MRNVQNYYFVLKGVGLAQKTLSGKFELKGYIRSKWLTLKQEEPSSQMLGSFKQQDFTLSEVPPEFIAVRKMSKVPNGQISSHVTPTYFNVPQICCLSREFINYYNFELAPKDLSKFISYYTSIVESDLQTMS